MTLERVDATKPERVGRPLEPLRHLPTATAAGTFSRWRREECWRALCMEGR